MRTFRYILIFFIRSFLRFIRKGYRYIRLTPNFRGSVYFYDKKYRKIFSVFSRERIDSDTADQIYTNHDYDLHFLKRFEEINCLYNNIIKNNKVPLVIDCGANIGLSSRYFAEEFPESFIIAIEPEKNNFLMALKNCNGVKNISAKNAAIGSSKGYVSIPDTDVDNNAFRTSISSNDEDIEVLTINEIISSHDNYSPFIVKIDIEGFEDNLFSKNTEWVAKTPLIIIETHDWMLPKQANSKNFLKIISHENRDFIHRGENIFSIMN